MLYHDYGKTGKKISRISFGGMRFKDIGDRKGNVEMLLDAAKGGINYFDTAPGYFGTKSEEIFGEAFEEMKRQDFNFYCATKTSKSSST